MRAGVAGAGVFGGYHAEKYAALDETRLTAIFDPDPSASERLAARHGAQAYSDLGAFLDAVDILSIAAPVSAHASLATAALNAGKALYVEKPIAATDADAERLVALAAEKNLVLAVGHQERVVFDAFRPDDLTARTASFARIGPPSGRAEDVSVVFDLMIHDIDLALQLGFGPPVTVAAAGDGHFCAASVDFSCGGTAHFLASRRAPTQRRDMVVDGEDYRFTIDFCARAAQRDKIALVPSLQIGDPLKSSIHRFIKAVQNVSPVLVDGRAGEAALKLANKIENVRRSFGSGEIADLRSYS